MKNIKMLLLVPAAVLAAACGRDNSKTDDALKNDLALASQAQPYMPQQVTSPTEMGYAYNPYTGQFQPVPQSPYGYPQAQAPAVQRVSTRPATTRRASSSSGSRVIYSEPARAEPIRNTKRDAVIGAAAGAVLGATVSRDKVKGAIIGAAAGGVLGGIIGHTIDVKRPGGY
jgi:YmgG-like glycine-zipper protein